jgi:hypothetical protein
MLVAGGPAPSPSIVDGALSDPDEDPPQKDTMDDARFNRRARSLDAGSRRPLLPGAGDGLLGARGATAADKLGAADCPRNAQRCVGRCLANETCACTW